MLFESKNCHQRKHVYYIIEVWKKQKNAFNSTNEKIFLLCNNHMQNMQICYVKGRNSFNSLWIQNNMKICTLSKVRPKSKNISNINWEGRKKSSFAITFSRIYSTYRFLIEEIFSIFFICTYGKIDKKSQREREKWKWPCYVKSKYAL